MSKLNDIVEGMNLLLRHDAKAECNTEHDTIYVSGPPPEKMHPKDAAKLEELHWLWDTKFESWMKFT